MTEILGGYSDYEPTSAEDARSRIEKITEILTSSGYLEGPKRMALIAEREALREKLRKGIFK